MKIERITVGPFEVNCAVVWGEGKQGHNKGAIPWHSATYRFDVTTMRRIRRDRKEEPWPALGFEYMYRR